LNQSKTSDVSPEPPHATLVTQHVALAVTKLTIDPMWILCDNESTMDVFNNKNMLVNISKTKHPIRLKGIDANSIEVEEEGELVGYGKVYYHPQVTANVLSFFNITKRYRSVIYNNQEQDAFLVTRDDGSVFEFIPSLEGLYYYDFRNSIARSKTFGIQESQTTMVVESVEALQRNYTACELKQADTAQRLYVMMGRPSIRDFSNMLKKGKLLNNPVTIEDYYMAEKIYGQDLGVIKGKTICTKPKMVTVDIGYATYEKCNIVLAVDIMHFTSLYFLVTVSRNIKFITTQYLPDRKEKTIIQAIKQTISIYQGKGHIVTDVEFTETDKKPIHTILADN